MYIILYFRAIMSVVEEDRRGDDEQGAGGGVDLPLSSKVKASTLNMGLIIQLLKGFIFILYVAISPSILRIRIDYLIILLQFFNGLHF